MNADATKHCEVCKSEITPDQIINRQAGLVRGVLLCPACVELKRREAMEAHRPGATQAVPSSASAPRPAVATEGDGLISLVAEDAQGGQSKIRSFAEGSTLAGEHHDAQLHRPVTGMNEPPTRCRTFHGKLTPASLAHMDDLICEWLDANPDVFIKHVISAVGPFEAKHVEQHLILTLFY